jgi:hypothetical protein
MRIEEIKDIRPFGSPQAAVLFEGPKDILEHLVALSNNMSFVRMQSLSQKELEALHEFQINEEIALSII